MRGAITRPLLIGVALVATAGVDARPGDGEAARAREAVYAMESAYAKIRDYTAVLHKRERVRGELMPTEQIEVKFRKPLSVYMKWIAGPNEGREVIYVRGANDGKMIAHKGSFPDVTVSLRPTSSMAMQGNRHPITDVGFGHMIDIVARDARRSALHPEDRVTYVDLGESLVHGAASRCLEQLVPPPAVARYYAARARLCYAVRTKLPTRVTVWDTGGELLEDYGYAQIRVDVGLGDAEFDPGNPAYKF